jgi:broad specificity phosphatase PhoE
VAVRKVLNAAASAVIAIVLFVVMALPAWAAGTPMTLTFVRHGQSTANAAGILNTAVPGPGLTALGVQQAQDVAAVLATQGHDGIYASTMIRTQQTAAPLGTPVVLPGLQEIDGGVFEGTPERGPLALLGYAGPPLAWTFGLRAIPILGSSDTGNAFDARVDGAVKTIYDTGDRNPVVYSHGATIMFWVMMNVDNPDPLLILTHPLDNTDVVVVNGTPDDGWTLTDWDGVHVDPNPSLVGRLVVAVRDVLVGLQGGSRPATTSVPTTGVTTLARTEQTPESPASTTAAPSVTALTSRKSKKPDGAQPEDSTVATNGATDLSDGNKARPDAVEPTAAEPKSAEPKSAEPEGDQTQPSTSPVAPKSAEAGPDDDAAKPEAA